MPLIIRFHCRASSSHPTPPPPPKTRTRLISGERRWRRRLCQPPLSPSGPEPRSRPPDDKMKVEREPSLVIIINTPTPPPPDFDPALHHLNSTESTRFLFVSCVFQFSFMRYSQCRNSPSVDQQDYVTVWPMIIFIFCSLSL